MKLMTRGLFALLIALVAVSFASSQASATEVEGTVTAGLCVELVSGNVYPSTVPPFIFATIAIGVTFAVIAEASEQTAPVCAQALVSPAG